MKHILNNLSEEVKNNIREQHTGGMSVNTDRFKTLMESKLGNVKPIVSEEEKESWLSKRKIGKEMRDAARRWVNSKSDEERDEIEMEFKDHDGWIKAIGDAYDEQW